MKTIRHIYTYALLLVVGFAACTGKNITGKFYLEHRPKIDSIKRTYEILNRQQPFSLTFSDERFRTVTIDIQTDSLTYIYDFLITDPRLTDTLQHYKLDTTGVKKLISLMQTIRCTWVNRFEFYTDDQKKSLIFISVKPVAVKPLFKARRYYMIAYYAQPQYYDNEGRLLDKRKTRRLRKIQGEVFHRINDTVCYTISTHFR
jgi:hypothetical protein